MANNEFIEVENVSWFSRIKGSVFSVIIGIIFFIASFVILFINEGRKDLSKYLKKAVVIFSNKKAEISLNNKLVCVKGNLSSNEKITDGFLKPYNYLLISRKVEVYSWTEEVRTKKIKRLGGGYTKIKKYRYIKKWVNSLPDFSRFKKREYAIRVVKDIEDKEIKVNRAKIGIYSLNLKNLTLPSAKYLYLDKSKVNLPNGYNLDDGYIYKGKGSLSNPEIGDMRISYKVVYPLKDVVVFGKLSLDNLEILPYKDKGVFIYRVFKGNKQEAIKKSHSEFILFKWIFRFVGFVLMWLGLSLSFSLITTIAEVVPFIGDITGIFVFLFTFVVSLILTFITIFISIILHNLIVLISLLLIIIIAIILILNKKKKLPPLPQ